MPAPPVQCLGCGLLIPRLGTGRCDRCEKAKERHRVGRRGDRYGRSHRRLRSVWQAIASVRVMACARCSGPIRPGEPWHLDHLADGSSRPSHPDCNSTAPHRARTA